MTDGALRPRRVLAVGAHPDDIEFGCGATLARWAASGTEVVLLVLTDGSKGTWDVDADLTELVEVRRVEQEAAADALGATAVEFLDLVDGELEASRAERAAVCEVIRRVQPDTVVGHDPWKRYRLHPDHRRAGELVVDSVVAARDAHFFPDRGPAHRPERLLLFEADIPDHVEDAEPGLKAKLAALLCHRSQWRSTLGIEAGSPTEGAQRQALADRLREEAATAAQGQGLQLGEAFKRLEPL
ncbi:MAG TPA: PIG-L deacetylase family protein [Acidimicrobiia bacterium]|nr:PIG-L deacetylase family protein [Acidimicrobiia bacterium]